MPCLHPIKIRNKRYEKWDIVKLNNYCIEKIGVENCDIHLKGHRYINDWFEEDKTLPVYEYIPPDYYLYVPCGRCVECLKNKRQQWAVRLLIESRQYEHNTFLTLTLSNEYEKEFRKDMKRPLMLYIDRLRKHLGYRPKYFFVAELGDEDEHTGRLHYHGILFNTDKKQLPYELQRSKWKYGHAFTGYCNDNTCNYVVKYVTKGNEPGKKLPKWFKPFVLVSNGIGKAYLDTVDKSWHINGFDFRDVVKFGETIYPLPTYYRDKIYDEDVKLVKMLNRTKDWQSWFEKSFNGRVYDDPRLYREALDGYYRWSLASQLSNPLPPMRDSIGTLNAVNDFDRVDFLDVEQIKFF